MKNNISTFICIYSYSYLSIVVKSYYFLLCLNILKPEIFCKSNNNNTFEWYVNKDLKFDYYISNVLLLRKKTEFHKQKISLKKSEKNRQKTVFVIINISEYFSCCKMNYFKASIAFFDFMNYSSNCKLNYVHLLSKRRIIPRTF